MNRKYPLVLIIIFFLALPARAWFDWETIKTDNFTVFYKHQDKTLARRTLAELEAARPLGELITGNKITGVPIVIENAGSIVNGATDPIFYRINIYFTPPTTGGLGFTQSWPRAVGFHEYIHLLHLTRAEGTPGLLTGLFGNIFSPNLASPGWIIEGITVYSESSITSLEGRLNDGYFDAFIRARAKDGRIPTPLEGAASPHEYPLGTGIYLYGGEFLRYLARTYGEDKFARFFGVYGSGRQLIDLDTSAIIVFGKSFPELWREWWETESKQAQAFQYEGEKVTARGWYLANLVIDGDKAYYCSTRSVKNGPFETYRPNELVERDLPTGRERVIASPTASFATKIRVRDGKVYYGETEWAPGYPNLSYSTYGTITLLRELDLKSGAIRTILKDRIRCFEILADGTIVYAVDRPHDFGSELYQLKNGAVSRLFITSYLIEDLVRGNEKLIATARRDLENFNLYEIKLNGELAPLLPSPFLQAFPAVSGDKLYFSQNDNRQYLIYALDLKNGGLARLTSRSYAVYPAYDERRNELYFLGLNSSGLDVYKEPAVFNEIKKPTYERPLPREPTIPESLVKEGTYLDNLATMAPKIRLPFYAQSGARETYGLGLMGRDAIGHFPFYYVGAQYDTFSQVVSYEASLTCDLFAPLSMTASYSNLVEKEYSLDISLPLIVRMTAGLSSVYIGAYGRTFRNETRKEISPYFGVGWLFPGSLGGASGSLFMPIERQRFGSAVNRMGFYGCGAVGLNLGENKIDLGLRGIYDPDYDGTTFPLIRGYSAALTDKKGGVASLDLTRPLFGIRGGLWEAATYFEDLCGTLFINGASSDQGGSQLAWGAELHQEIKTLFSVPIDLGLIFALNQEGEESVGLTIKGSL